MSDGDPYWIDSFGLNIGFREAWQYVLSNSVISSLEPELNSDKVLSHASPFQLPEVEEAVFAILAPLPDHKEPEENEGALGDRVSKREIYLQH